MQSTTLWTPSVSIADEPVIAAATNFETAMPRLARSAMTSVRLEVVGVSSDVDHPPERGEHALVHHLASVGCGKTVLMKSVSTSSAVLPMV